MRCSPPGALVVGLIVAAMAAVGPGVPTGSRAAAGANGAYQGHRVLVWAIDKGSHAVVGFDSALLRPGGGITLRPTAGYEVRFEAGPVRKVQVADFRTEREEDHIPLKVAHGTGSAEGTKDVRSPFLHLGYGTNERLASVSFAVPVGTGTGTFPGAAEAVRAGVGEGSGALEDLLLAGTADPVAADYIRPHDVIEVYKLLGRTARRERWSRRLSEGSPVGRVVAAAVLTVVGDERGTDAFGDACLEARGNDQVRLADLLCEMPPSDRLLETTVRLVVAHRAYRIEAPEGVGVADVDRRSRLIRTLAERYPKAKVRRFADVLRPWAESEEGRRRGGAQVLDLLAEG